MSLQTTLTWSTENAVSASISGLGAVALSGSIAVDVDSSPEAFTITATNCVGASATASVTVTITAPTVTTFTGGGDPVTCANRNSTLSWDVTGANLIEVTDDQGNTLYSGTDLESTITVYPGQSTVYTLNAYAGPVLTQATATISVQGSLLIVPLTGASVYFNDGASYAPGLYLITCCGGAFSWNGIAAGVNANDRANLTSQAFKVFSRSTVIDSPGSYPNYGTLTNSDAANAGLVQYFNHDGGPIGMKLVLDTYMNVAGFAESPGFSIAGPAPQSSISANPSPVIAGTSVTLAWNVVGETDTVSIDNGIGDVDATGTMALTPTVTTRYTITAIGSGIVTTAYVDVLIGSPSIPVATITPACSGAIGISWTAPAFTLSTKIERGTDGIAFTQVGSVNAGTNVFTDTVTPGVVYYYRMRNYDGHNYSPYTVPVQTASLVAPAPISNLAVGVNLGVPLLSWTPTSASTVLKRGTASGGETSLSTVTTVAGVPQNYRDSTALNGVLYYYVALASNGCGSSVASNEVSARPQANVGSYSTSTTA